MRGILVIELKGFEKIAIELAKRMDYISLTAERVRGIGREIVNQMIKKVSYDVSPLERHQIAADTWFFIFDTVKSAIDFGCRLLHLFQKTTYEKGIFYLKPSIALSYGTPKLQGGKVLDNISIETYRTADKGEPFNFYILKEALPFAKQIEGIPLTSKKFSANMEKEIATIKWKELSFGNEEIEFFIPTLVLDNEVIFSSTAQEAMKVVRAQQKEAIEIRAFGGPVPIKIPFYLEYLKETLDLMKKDKNKKWIALSYIPTDEPFYGYFWLELCRKLSIKYPQRLKFKAFALAKNQLRPFSYQLFDEDIVHLGIRAFSIERGTSVMSSAMVLKNKRIVQKFHDNFNENWQKMKLLSEKEFGKIVSKLEHLKDRDKREAMKKIDLLIAGAGL